MKDMARRKSCMDEKISSNFGLKRKIKKEKFKKKGMKNLDENTELGQKIESFNIYFY